MKNRLTRQYVAEFKKLLSNETAKIWESGDYLVAHPLSETEFAELCVKVDREPSTLFWRERIARRFPADAWNRDAGNFGVYKELARLKDDAVMRRLLKSKPHWVINDMRRVVSEMLLLERETEREAYAEVAAKSDFEVLERPARRDVIRTTHLKLGNTDLKVRNHFTEDGMFRLTLDASLAEGQRIRKSYDSEGRLVLSIPLDLEA